MKTGFAAGFGKCSSADDRQRLKRHCWRHLGVCCQFSIDVCTVISEIRNDHISLFKFWKSKTLSNLQFCSQQVVQYVVRNVILWVQTMRHDARRMWTFVCLCEEQEVEELTRSRLWRQLGRETCWSATSERSFDEKLRERNTHCWRCADPVGCGRTNVHCLHTRLSLDSQSESSRDEQETQPEVGLYFRKCAGHFPMRFAKAISYFMKMTYLCALL